MTEEHSSTATSIEVTDAGDLRKYRTEIPNLILEMGLSPHALALYLHLKRTAGQKGKCWKSTRTLAKDANMSAGKVSGARAELEERDLIVVERPSRRKAVEVTITDVWLKNFQHFASVQNMNTERSEYETRNKPLEEGVEANASRGIEETPDSPNAVALEKWVVDKIYAAMVKNGTPLEGGETFTYHLGRAQHMLAKSNPTDSELEELPDAFVRLWKIKGKANAFSALNELRRQTQREEVLAEDQEAPHPHSSEAEAARDKPRAPHWYVAFYPDLDRLLLDRWLRDGSTHTEIVGRLERGAA